jgi:hypothetical protein
MHVLEDDEDRMDEPTPQNKTKTKPNGNIFDSDIV